MKMLRRIEGKGLHDRVGSDDVKRVCGIENMNKTQKRRIELTC